MCIKRCDANPSMRQDMHLRHENVFGFVQSLWTWSCHINSLFPLGWQDKNASGFFFLSLSLYLFFSFFLSLLSLTLSILSLSLFHFLSLSKFTAFKFAVTPPFATFSFYGGKKEGQNMGGWDSVSHWKIDVFFLFVVFDLSYLFTWLWKILA